MALNIEVLVVERYDDTVEDTVIGSVPCISADDLYLLVPVDCIDELNALDIEYELRCL